MTKKWLLNVLVLILTGMVFMGCPTATSDDGGGDDVTDQIFDINNMPSPSYWNDLGEIKHLPNLFQFADGTKVTTTADWERRRAEIAKIMEYYVWGPDLTVNGVTVSVQNADDVADTETNQSANVKYTNVTLGYQGKTTTVTFGVKLPTSGTPPYPAFVNYASSNRPAREGDAGYDDGYGYLDQQGVALIQFNVNNFGVETRGGDGVNEPHVGAMQDLFGDNVNDINNTGLQIAWAWGVGRLMDAIEAGAFSANGRSGSQLINPDQLIVTGGSRWGKGALVAGAYAKSKTGKMIAVTAPVSAGSGGPTIERFISHAGLASMNTIQGSTGKDWYFRVLPAESSYHGTDSSLVVRAVHPDQKIASDETYNGWVRDPEQLPANWGGIQTLAEGRYEMMSFFGNRLHQFKDLYENLNIDYAEDMPDRKSAGVLTTIPFDMHFMSALIAPRALVVLEGFYTFRGNPEGQYLCFLAADEVYKFLGAERYNGIKMYKLPHSYTNYERFDIVDFAKAYFAGQAPDRKFREPPFPANDPRSRDDYSTLDWARPGATPLSERIKDANYVADHTR